VKVDCAFSVSHVELMGSNTGEIRNKVDNAVCFYPWRSLTTSFQLVHLYCVE
jgi:hypothetical protein